MKRTSLYAVALLSLGACVMAGCGSPEPAMTKQEQTSFKGGPMPPEAAKKMQEALAKARTAQQGNGQAQPTQPTSTTQ